MPILAGGVSGFVEVYSMSAWRQLKAPTDAYIDEIKGILGKLFINVSSAQEDACDGFDLEVKSSARFAVRLRSSKYLKSYPNDITFRKHVATNGFDCEYRKIFEQGMCDFLFYGFMGEEKLLAWAVVDLSVLRKLLLEKDEVGDFKVDQKTRYNNDNTSFVSINLDDVSEAIVARKK